MSGGISTSMEIYSTTLRTHDHHHEKHRQLETILALSWANEGDSSAVLGHVGSSWGVLESSWGSPRPSWGNLGGILALLEASWSRLGVSWGRLGASWGRLGSVLERLGGVLGASWRRLGRLGGVLEASWRRHRVRLVFYEGNTRQKANLKPQSTHFTSIS